MPSAYNYPTRAFRNIRRRVITQKIRFLRYVRIFSGITGVLVLGCLRWFLQEETAGQSARPLCKGSKLCSGSGRLSSAFVDRRFEVHVASERDLISERE
jgi:hypothetical protein